VATRIDVYIAINVDPRRGVWKASHIGVMRSVCRVSNIYKRRDVNVHRTQGKTRGDYIPSVIGMMSDDYKLGNMGKRRDINIVFYRPEERQL
jgi:hypothetical protein